MVDPGKGRLFLLQCPAVPAPRPTPTPSSSLHFWHTLPLRVQPAWHSVHTFSLVPSKQPPASVEMQWGGTTVQPAGVGVGVGVATGLNFFSRNSSASATADFRATICVQERGRGGRLDGVRVTWKRSQGRRALFFCLFFQTRK